LTPNTSITRVNLIAKDLLTTNVAISHMHLA